MAFSIQITELTKQYRKGPLALAGVTIDIQSGMFGLLGPNGAGKSTLLRILAGVETQSAGEFRVDGESIALGYRDRIGYLPQRPKFHEQLTVRAWLKYFAQLKALPARLWDQRIDELLYTHDLADVANQRIARLSGGLRQRLAMATAIQNDPELLLLDEPLTNLDPDMRITLTAWLAQQLPGRITIMATHSFAGLDTLATRIWYLNAGKLEADLTVATALQNLRGYVWQVKQAKATPAPACQAILQYRLLDGEIGEWRVLGQEPPQGAQAVAPTLEDVYGALTQGLLHTNYR